VVVDDALLASAKDATDVASLVPSADASKCSNHSSPKLDLGSAKLVFL
jgi:hypothetical protein